MKVTGTAGVIHIIVCLKQVSDPEAPSSVYRIDDDAKHVICRGVPPVISTYDENALEAALRIKDAAECKITAISMGKALAKPVLRKAMAAGADELILLDNAAFSDIDSYATAVVLTEAIKKIESYDLILTGLQAADTNAGVVGPGIAELLGIPCITSVRRVSVDGINVIAESILPDGYRTLQATLPVVLTVHKSLGDLRSAPAASLIEAPKRPVTVWTADDLQIQPAEHIKARLDNFFIPHHEPCIEMITGITPDDTAANLANKLFSIGAIKKS
ncbi:MAG: electron transfer flavoprotein subunit beta [Dehalococcoidia bacterium]|nr:electron transfer flavoprotein subunit beta [Dehalococcoidia bacterium]